MATNTVQTLNSQIEGYEGTYPETYMRATIIVILNARNRDLVRDMTLCMAKICKLVNPINGNEGYSGPLCLQYFQYLYRTYDDELNKYIRNDAFFFFRQFTAHIDMWAPHLLTYERSYSVGEETYKLLKEALFKPVLEEIVDVRHEKLVASGVRKLYHGCTVRAQDLLQVETRGMRRAAYAIICTMRECQEYLRLLSELEGAEANAIKEAGDEALIAQYEGFKQVYDTLPTQTDDDFGQSGELANEWEDLDLADDVLGEVSELTDVEVSDDELGS